MKASSFWLLVFMSLNIMLFHRGFTQEFSGIFNVNTDEKMKCEQFYSGVKYWNRTNPPNPPFLAKIIAIANKLKNSGETDAAIYWYQFAMPYTFFGGRDYRLTLYNQLGGLFHLKGDGVTALSMYHKAYLYAPDPVFKAKILVNQSNVYSVLRNYSKALEGLESSLPVFKANHLPVWVAIDLGAQALIYKAYKDYQKAIELNRQAYNTIDSSESVEYPQADRRSVEEAIDIKSRLLNNLAEIFLTLQQPDSAYFYLNQIHKDFNRLPIYTQAGIRVSYAEYYQQKHQYGEAIAVLKKASFPIQEGRFQEIQLKADKVLADLYETTGRFKQALYWRNEYIELKDSLTSYESIHRINALETKYYLSQKDKLLAQKELRITQQDNKLQRRNWIALTSVLLSAAVLLILVISRKGYRNKQKLLNAELKHARQQQKLARMEAMIDGETNERTRIAKELHDGVVNEVLALKLNLTDLEKDFSVLRYMPKFKSILHQSEEVAMRLRETAHNLMPVKIRENGLFNTIAAFIEKVNAPVHFTFQHYGSLPALEPDTERTILLSVLELIQNILKHASASEALVQLNYFEDILSITVEDNGVGLPPNDSDNQDGIGLQGVIENMEVMGATIDIQSGEYTGTTVLIEIPLAGFKLEQENLRDAI